MIYCFIKRVDNPFYIEEEMKYCQQHNIGCLYHPDQDTFTTMDNQPININEKTIFPRSGVLQIPMLIQAIQQHGGNSFIIEESIEKVDNWLQYYQPKRKMIALKGKELLESTTINQLEQEMGSELFLKTKQKNYSGIILTSFLKDSQSLLYRTLLHHLETEFLVSEKVTICQDNLGNKEYRCFIYKGKIINISRLTDTIHHTIDSIIYEKAQQLVSQLASTSFLDSYVIDIFEYQDKNGIKEIDIVECNEIASSGTYLYNTILSLENKNILEHKTLPPEKRDRESDTTIESSPSVIDTEPGTFAYDLKSIYATGTRIPIMHIKLPNGITTDLLGTNTPLISFSSFKVIDTLEDSNKVKKLEP